MANRLTSRSWIWWSSGALALLALLFFFLLRTPPTSPPAAAVAPPTAGVEFANDRIRREIRTQGLTVDRARDLFALEVGPLPGVTPPAGEVRPTFSGTYALAQLIAVRDLLTPPQQARLSELLDPDRSVMPAPVPVLPTFSASRASGITAMYEPTLVPRLIRASLPDPKGEAARATFQEMYDWANAKVSALTGHAPIPAIVLTFENFEQETEGKQWTAWVLSGAWTASSTSRTTVVKGVPVKSCLSRIDMRKFQGWPIDVYLSVVTHEVVHCYQQIDADTASDVATTSGWLNDGEATWAQMQLVESAVFTSLQTHWANYLNNPRTHLFDRAYDAAGFFAHVADATSIDWVGKRLLEAYHAGKQTNDESAYDLLLAGKSDRVLDTWASSYFRTHPLQPIWDVKGPGAGNISSTRPTPTSVSVGAGDTVPLTHADPWELSLVQVAPSSDIVVIVSTKGHVALIDRTEQVNRVLRPFDGIALCVKGECKCPPGLEGNVPPTVPAFGPIDVGLTGGKTGADAYAHGVSIDEYCERKDPLAHLAPLLPPGGGGSDGGSEPMHGAMRSDPHLVTYDGRWYDLQALGELVLTKSTVDDFAVHVRLGRIGALRTVSVATSMATRVGRDRVSVTLDPATSTPILRVNGTRSTSDFVMLNGGSVRTVFNEAGTGYVVEFDDGTRVGVTPFVRQGLNVWVVPSAVRRGKLTGLLGDADGDSTNEPVANRTGIILPIQASYDDLYGTFANSWRLTASESLLDYAPGESPATFTDNSFPDRASASIDAQTSAAAEATCKAAGISDDQLLQNCAFDIAATGNREYARSYAPQQRRMTYYAAAAPTLTGTGRVTTNTARMRTRSTILEGRVTDATADAFASFDVFKGDILYLDPDACQKPRFAQLQGPDGKAIGGPAVPCGYRLQAATSGTYRVALNPFHEFAGTYRMSWLAIRPDRVTPFTPGDTLRGTLGMRAEQDVFLLEQKAPGSVTFVADGCSANFDIAMYYGDDELIGAAPACRMGTVTLPKAGTYRVVMNPFNTVTGAYQIPTK